RLFHQASGVGRVHATPVENANLGGELADLSSKQCADQTHRLVGVLRRGGATGPDSPNRLVRDRQVAGALDVDAIERGIELARDDLLSPRKIVLLERLA